MKSSHQDQLTDYYSSLNECHLSPTGESRLHEALHKRKVRPTLAWGSPAIATALVYAFLVWCSHADPAQVHNISHPLLEQQMAAAGLPPEPPAIDLSGLRSRRA